MLLGFFRQRPPEIEADSLADEGDGAVTLLFRAVVVQDQEPWRTLGTATDGEDRAHAELLHGGDVEQLDLHAELGQHLHARAELFRIEDIGRLVGEVAGEMHALCNSGQALIEALRLGGLGGDESRGGQQLRLIRRSLVWYLPKR